MLEILTKLPRDTEYYTSTDGKTREYPAIADGYATAATTADIRRDELGFTSVYLHRRLNVQPPVVASNPLDQELEPRRYWIHVGGVNSFRGYELIVHDENSEYVEIP